MKTLLYFSLLLWPSVMTCQKNIPLIISNGDVIFEAIATPDSLTAAEIHERTLNWIGAELTNAQYVTALDTPDRIVRKFSYGYLFNWVGMKNVFYDHVITFEIKEGKVRVRILIVNLGGTLVKSQTEWKTYLEEQRKSVETSLNELYRSYVEELAENKKDW